MTKQFTEAEVREVISNLPYGFALTGEMLNAFADLLAEREKASQWLTDAQIEDIALSDEFWFNASGVNCFSWNTFARAIERAALAPGPLTELPTLPAPHEFVSAVTKGGEDFEVGVFTAEQMHEYARAAIAAIKGARGMSRGQLVNQQIDAAQTLEQLQAERATELANKLGYCAYDPMWPNHAEVNKSLLLEAVEVLSLIRGLARQIAVGQDRIKKMEYQLGFSQSEAKHYRRLNPKYVEQLAASQAREQGLREVLMEVNKKFDSRPYGTGSYIRKELREKVVEAIAQPSDLSALHAHDKALIERVRDDFDADGQLNFDEWQWREYLTQAAERAGKGEL